MSEDTMLYSQGDEFEDGRTDDGDEAGVGKYLVFLSDGIFYGVHTNHVMNIITETAITYLPMLPRHIRGVINLRGQIVPIIDFRLLLGRPAGEEHCTIVLGLEGMQISILVDRVDQMVDIHRENILPVPTQSAQKVVSGMCTMPGGGTMLVLDCDVLRRV